MIKLFVYGTLKKGFVNHFVLEEQKYLGEYILNNHKLLLILGDRYNVPSIVKDDAGKVKGELYLVTPSVFKLVSQMETGYNITEENGVYWFTMPQDMLNRLNPIPLVSDENKVYNFKKTNEIKLKRVK